MAIVKTTAPGEDFPDKKKSAKTVPVKSPARSGGPQVRQGAPTNSKTFFNDTMAELKRVVWPSREERMAGTIVTIGLLFFFAFYIFVLNNLITTLFDLLKLPK